MCTCNIKVLLMLIIQMPECYDNSGAGVTIYSTGGPGMYRVGRPWTITYTAKDKAGNEAKCEFTFKLSGRLSAVFIESELDENGSSLVCQRTFSHQNCWSSLQQMMKTVWSNILCHLIKYPQVVSLILTF